MPSRALMVGNSALLRFKFVILCALGCTRRVYSLPSSISNDGPLTLQVYHPPRYFEVLDSEVLDCLPRSSQAKQSLEARGATFLHEDLDIEFSSIQSHGSTSSKYGTYVAYKQAHNGIPFANAFAHIVVDTQDQIVTLGSSFIKPKEIASPIPSVSLEALLPMIESSLEAPYVPNSESLKYLAHSDKSVSLVYAVQVQDLSKGIWDEAYVDAHDGKLHSVVSFVSQATYNAAPLNTASFADTPRPIIDPEDRKSSPLGWHNTTKFGLTHDTTGNNVAVYSQPNRVATKESSPNHVFDFKYDPSIGPLDSQENLDACKTNIFYLVNAWHDVLFSLGFDEGSNFQLENLSGAGSQNDPIEVLLQPYSAGLNNAYITTPPDGISPILNTFVWTDTTPHRHSAMANDVILHELSHPLISRLVNKQSGTNCLSTVEAKGLSEGWGDAFAEWFIHDSPSDFIIGGYLTGDKKGIRRYPYSTNFSVNPLKYSSAGPAKSPTQIYPIGEVWATILHNVFVELLSAGFTPRDTLELLTAPPWYLPCNPTITHVREVTILVARTTFGDKVECAVWRGFASRGLGPNARNFVDDFSVPVQCTNRSS